MSWRILVLLTMPYVPLEGVLLRLMSLTKWFTLPLRMVFSFFRVVSCCPSIYLYSF